MLPLPDRLGAAVRRGLLLSILTPAALAQQAPAPQTDTGARTLDTVQVTGSRIRRAELETQVPVHVLNREDIERTGLNSIGDVVQQLTGSASSFNGKRNASGNDGFPSDGGGVGAGATTVDLRGLGSKRVLVLVDGMRWVNESSASGVGAAVDLNTIPLAIVERIEVLEDGASSLYGSDAIAGVVNVITRRDFEGGQVTLNYGQYEPGDGEGQGIDLAFGGALGERGNWFIGGSYFKQDPVFSRDRERTRVPVFGTGNLLGSSRVPGGRFIFEDPEGNEYDLTTNAGLSDPTYTPGLPDCASGVPRTDGFHCFGAEDAFNYAPYNLVLSPSERSGLFGQVRVDLGENVRAYGRALVNRRESQNQAAPEPIDLGPGAGTTYAANVFIPAANPYNPFGFDLTTGPGGNIITIRRRPIEGGPRIFDQTVDTQYVGGGLEGSFGEAQQWFWDVNVAWSRNEAEQENRGSYNSLRIQQALDPAACAAVSGCVLLDIFGFDTMTPEMIAWVSPLFRDRSEQTLTQATANFGGDLFELPAGPLAFASGYEYRKYEGEYDPDPATVRGEYNGVPSLSTRGEYDVNEVYVELSVPLFKDSAFGKALDLSLAGRYSDYSTFGGEFTPKYGLRWQVVDELLLRTTYAEGFRAPSIGELFGQPSRFDANIVDPCLGANYAANAANCTTLGVAPGTPQFDPQIGVETGGNPNLEPERSRSFSAGLVWTPSLLEDSALARRVDFETTYYRHDIQGAIQAPDPQTQLDLCVQTLDPAYCDGIVRNGTTDQIESFANYLTNFTSIQTSGWDFDVYWALPESAAGDFKLTWLNTWVTDYTAAGADGTQQPLQPGRLVSDPVTRSIPEWTSSLSLDWTRGNWSASWTARHLSQLVEQCGDATGLPACLDNPAPGQNRLGSTTLHDFQVGYRFDLLEGLQLAVGANNAFGKEPPICLSCNLNSFDGSTYDLPGGGYYYVRADLRF